VAREAGFSRSNAGFAPSKAQLLDKNIAEESLTIDIVAV
jgi:hypothetical protein